MRSAAEAATLAIFDLLPNEAVPVYINQVILGGKGSGLHALARVQTKVASLKLLSAAPSERASQPILSWREVGSRANRRERATCASRMTL
mgnify:CR=1 FL=1